MIRYQYVHLPRRKNPITVAYVMEPDSTVESGMTIRFATAFCADHDSFHRKIGRAIAEGRLNKCYEATDGSTICSGIVIPVVIGFSTDSDGAQVVESLNQAIVREIRQYVARNLYSIMEEFRPVRRVDIDNDIMVVSETASDSSDSASL